MKTSSTPSMFVVRREQGERLTFAKEYSAWLDDSARRANLKLAMARTDDERFTATREVVDVTRRRVAFKRKEPVYGT